MYPTPSVSEAASPAVSRSASASRGARASRRDEVLVFGDEARLVRPCASLLAASFDVQGATDLVLAKQFVESRPYAAIVCGLDDPKLVQPFLAHARRIVPQVPLLVVGAPERVLVAELSCHLADELVVEPVGRELLERTLARTAPARRLASRRTHVPAVIEGAGWAVHATMVEVDGAGCVVTLPAAPDSRLRIGTPVVLRATHPFRRESWCMTGVLEQVAVASSGPSGVGLRAKIASASPELARFAEELAKGVVVAFGPGTELAMLATALRARTPYHYALAVETADPRLALRNADLALLAGAPWPNLGELVAGLPLDEVPPAVVHGATAPWGYPVARVFYEAPRGPEPGECARVLASAFHERARGASDDVEINHQATNLSMLLEATRAVALQTTAGDLCTTAAEQLERLVDSRAALVHLRDPRTNTVVVADRRRDLTLEHAASSGLCAFVLHTGAPLRLERADHDPRFVGSLDLPLGEGTDRLMLVPVAGDDHRSLAVLSLCRSRHEPPFTEGELRLVRSFASHVASAFAQVRLQGQVAEVLQQRRRAFRGQAEKVFRREAIEHNEETFRLGAPLGIELGWVSGARYYFLAVVLITLVSLCVARITEVAAGPAVVALGNTDDVVVRADGVVEEVLVKAGDVVEVGQPLVRLAAERERNELRRAQAEWDRLLLQRLEDPRDRTVEQRLVTLDAEVQRNRSLLAERTIVANRAGVVRAVRPMAGQMAHAGDAVASISGRQSVGVVRAAFPYNYRPLVRPGMLVDVELTHFRNVHIALRITEVHEQPVSPDETASFLQGASASTPNGKPSTASLVVVARLESGFFEYQGKSYPFSESMTGVARVRLRSRSGIYALFPQLEHVLER